MKGLTTDPNHPALGHGSDDTPVPQNSVYLVLSAEERAKGFLKPYRTSYQHETCGGITTMGQDLSETYARDPWFYGSTYCVRCSMHRPLSEFRWSPDGEPMDPRKWTDAERDRIGALRAASTVDPVIDAQHDETGRIWTGPRSQLPRRYYEICTDEAYAAQAAETAPAVTCDHFPGQAVCEWCHGTGAIDAPTSADDPSCSECDGEGYV